MNREAFFIFLIVCVIYFSMSGKKQKSLLSFWEAKAQKTKAGRSVDVPETERETVTSGEIVNVQEVTEEETGEVDKETVEDEERMEVNAEGGVPEEDRVTEEGRVTEEDSAEVRVVVKKRP